ncbi:hypothetical protein HUU05_12250 [candidate division KSB1 bacterium]|nr:hypothetical protein [candidate division KSB1 bacterium]
MSRRSPVSWIRGLSLADKCLVLFGGAVVLIVCAALAAPWFRMFALVEEGQLDRAYAALYETHMAPLPAPVGA